MSLCLSDAAAARPQLLDVQLIGSTDGGLSESISGLDDEDQFGAAVAAFEDLDGNGSVELVVGSPLDDDGGPNRGALRVLFRDLDGSVLSERKISSTLGGFGGLLRNGDQFGSSLASLGDLDGDGQYELAVGALGDSDTGTTRGAVWILSFAADGSVTREVKLSTLSGGFGGALEPYDWFGAAVTRLDDLDGDGIDDLAVGAPRADEAGAGGAGPSDPLVDTGAVWLVLLNADGTAHDQLRIDASAAALALPDGTLFGFGLTTLRDGLGGQRLVAGAPLDDGGGAPGSRRGAVWLLDVVFDANAGGVAGAAKICSGTAGFGATLYDFDQFGYDVGRMPDVDGDGGDDLIVGAPLHDDGGSDRGAAWILGVDAAGVVQTETELSQLSGGFGGPLSDGDLFGASLTGLDELAPSGFPRVYVGAPGSDGGGPGRGGLWSLELSPDGVVAASLRLGDGAIGFPGELALGDQFGSGVAFAGDFDGDGIDDLAVGAPGDEAGGANVGALWLLILSVDGRVRTSQRIGYETGLALLSGDRFGSSVEGLGDVDGNGWPDLAVGANGAVWTLLLGAGGQVEQARKHIVGGPGIPSPGYGVPGFGRDVAVLGDVDGDGVVDLAVGAPFNLAPAGGAVFVLFLRSDGALAGSALIDGSSGFPAQLPVVADDFGAAVGAAGDLDWNGVPDLLVGAPGSADGGLERGAVWVLQLDAGGGVLAAEPLLGSSAAGAGLVPADGDRFGSSLAWLGDRDGNGRREFAAGVAGAGGGDGAVWAVELDADRRWSATTVLADAELLPGLEAGGEFGFAAAASPDFNGDMRRDLGVGATLEAGVGAVRMLLLDGVSQGPGVPFGCGVNPEGSLKVLGGSTALGEAIELAIDNPLGSQGIGAVALLAVGSSAFATAPCGVLVAGAGMAPDGVGELLLSDVGFVLAAGIWTGPPVPITISMPSAAALVGVSVYAQGALFGAGQAQELGLSSAIELRVGG